jgi:hypothetical protein
MIPIKIVTCLKNVSGTGPILERMTFLTGVPMYFGIIISFRQLLLGLLLFGTSLILVLQEQILFLELLPRLKQAGL